MDAPQSLQLEKERLRTRHPLGILAPDQLQVAMRRVDPAAARHHQQKGTLPCVQPSVVNGARLASHEAGGVDAFQREAQLLEAPHHVITVNVHGAPEAGLGHVGGPRVAGVLHLKDLKPAQIRGIAEGKLIHGAVQIAAEAVEGDQHCFGVFLPEGAQCLAEGSGIALLDLRLAESGRGCGNGCRQIYEVKLEHTDAVVVPVLQHIHEVGQKSAFGERHGAAILVQRILPSGRGLNLDQCVGAEPQAGLHAVGLTHLDPRIGTVGPVWCAPGAIASAGSKPKGVHHVVVESHASILQPQQLIQLAHGQGFSQRNVIREFVVGRPVIVDRDGCLKRG